MLTYYVPYSFGGSADYSSCQIRALADLGLEIELIAPRAFRKKFGASDFAGYTELIDRKPRKLPKPLRAVIFMKEMVQVHRTLAMHLDRSKADYLLLGDFGEYMAPVWAPILQRRKAVGGLRFGCIVHDPVRDLMRGPRWWHEASLKSAFGLLDDAFIHGPVPPQLSRKFPGINFLQVPHGVFPVEVSQPPKAKARELLGLPPGVPVLLQFGHVRDNKNIEVLIKSLPLLDQVHLVIAGKESSGSQRSGAFYREVARRMGVESRVHFRLGFVATDEISVLFAAADAVCLVYAKSFKSMSGVLAHALNYETPVVASGGDGPLKGIVQRYRLGQWLENVDDASVAAALKTITGGLSSRPEWQACREESSWERNASIVASCVRSVSGGPSGPGR